MLFPEILREVGAICPLKSCTLELFCHNSNHMFGKCVFVLFAPSKWEKHINISQLLVKQLEANRKKDAEARQERENTKNYEVRCDGLLPQFKALDGYQCLSLLL